VFLVSWRNPDASMAERTWDDYIEHAAIRAIEVTRDISGQDKINVLGFCVGGTIVSTALAVLAARGERPAASLTLLTTLLDFADTGILDVFVDEAHVQLREATLGGPAARRAGCCAAWNWPTRSRSCVRTTWSGTTWSTTTSRATRRFRSTCCSGMATPPICRARGTAGTCAIRICRTS
jgi:hypothetical protein